MTAAPGGGAGKLERRLVRRCARTPGRRVRPAAAVRALTVPLRRHPRAMVDLVASGAIEAARTGVGELRARLLTWKQPNAGAAEARAAVRRPRSRREWRRLRRLLDRNA